MGVGFSMWSQTIGVSGTVNTGFLCWEFVPTETSLDPGPNYTGYGGDVYGGPSHLGLDWTIQPGMDPSTIHQLDKNIGWTDVVQTDQYDLSVTLNNVYPCYYNAIDMHMYNCGTVPVKIVQPVLTYIDPHTGASVSTPVIAGSVMDIPGFDQYGGISNVIEIRWMNQLTGTQWEPGQEVEVSWGIHVLQAAKQGFNYSFSISTEAVQWNEYPPPA
jgi:hypothetical protein